ncbi:hypothetical protein ACA910_001388 [Epithemia clementina (nom. ined.)]
MLSRWGERCGLFRILAPHYEQNYGGSPKREKAEREEDVGTQDDAIPSPGNSLGKLDEATTESTVSKSFSGCVTENSQTGLGDEIEDEQVLSRDEDRPASSEDQLLSHKLPAVDEHDQMILDAQKSSEVQALARDDFCKNQRARYLHKASQTWYNDALVVSVHNDDGVEKPYYTILYHPRPGEEPVEKQTTRDRLAHVPWDENKTREILSSRSRGK